MDKQELVTGIHPTMDGTFNQFQAPWETSKIFREPLWIFASKVLVQNEVQEYPEALDEAGHAWVVLLTPVDKPVYGS